MAGEKEYDYVVTVKKQSQKVFSLISVLLLIFGVAANLYFYFIASYIQYQWLVPAVIATIIFIAGYEIIRSKQGDYIISFSRALLLCGVAFVFGPLHSFLFGALYLMAAFLERQVKHPLEFGFDKNGIILNSFPSKQYEWGEVINVILKDGILTIDLKSNRIIQRETEDTVTAEMEKEFNEFCSGHLAFGKEK